MIRSMLFVPGNSPAMLLNADIHGADAIILDLEDAVAPDQKDAARILVRNAIRFLGYAGCKIIVRINPLETSYCTEDIRAMVPLKPDMLMPTKVADAQTVKTISRMIEQAEKAGDIERGAIALCPLIETARGIEKAYEIALSDARVKGILLGAEDLTSDLRAVRTKTGEEIAYSRGRVVMAARAAGIDAYDTPFTDVFDDEGIREDAELARRMGFSGKAAISPRHIDAVNRAFSPTEEEIAYAQEVLDIIAQAKRTGRGAVSLRGKMIDKPIVDRARHVMDMAKQIGGLRHA